MKTKPLFKVGDKVKMVNADVLTGIGGVIDRVEQGKVYPGGYMYFFGPHGVAAVNADGSPRLEKV